LEKVNPMIMYRNELSPDKQSITLEWARPLMSRARELEKDVKIKESKRR